jgi:hypothetical protein
MRFGGFLSFLLHLAILLLVLFGLPDLFKQEEVVAPVAVQLATLADITAQPKALQTPPKPVVNQETPPPPAPTPPTPPTPPEPQPAEATPPEPTPPPTPPEPPPPVPQPEAAQQTPQEPVPIPDQQPTPPPPQEAKIESPPAPILRPPVPKPPKPKPQPKTTDFNALLKNVEQMKTTSTDTQQPQPDSPPQPDSATSDLSAPQLTMSELDAVRSQIQGCWYIDPGKKGADDMIVDVRVAMGQDGSVQSAVIVDQGRMALDGYYQAAAEAARRAILKCSPLHMPPGKYDTWKTTVFHFSPAGPVGQ